MSKIVVDVLFFLTSVIACTLKMTADTQDAAIGNISCYLNVIYKFFLY